jgi:transmembrane sensor
MLPDRLKNLMGLYFDKTINEADFYELSQWVTIHADDKALLQLLQQQWHTHDELETLSNAESERIIATILTAPSSKQIITSGNKVITINAKIFWLKRIAVAATVLIVFSIGYFALKPGDILPSKHAIAKITVNKNDVMPGGQKAILTLSDGSQIVLDSASNGLLGKQGGTKVIKLANGQVEYAATTLGSTETLYNTMSTPPGGKYELTLPDGSKVWLNASSSIHYPTAFLEKERRVTITGEAYFEIAKNPNKPFIVKIYNGAEVKVLGTHFNIKAYTDEDEIKTTLLEGSINIHNGSQNNLLVPGNQAKIDKNGILKVEANADLEEAVAWKNGNFQFNSADVTSVLKQAARWYNIEVVYSGKPSTENRFTGKIPMSVNLSRLLKWLEYSDVHFKLDGRKLIVSP